MQREQYKKRVSDLVDKQEGSLHSVAEELAKRINQMPKVGNGIEMNGLAYAVEYVNHKRGMVHLHLLGEVPAPVNEVTDSA